MARKKSMSLVTAKLQVNDNLKIVLESEVSARNNMIRDSLRFHRDRGKVISRVRSGLSADGVSKVDYGKTPVEILADELNISRSYVYKLATFYDIYNDSGKFQDLMDKFDDNNFHLSWSHFNCLVHVTDGDLREEIIDETVKNKLSVRGLHELLVNKKIEVDDEYRDEVVDPALAPPVRPVVGALPETATDEVEEDATIRPESNHIVDDVSTPSAKATLKKLVVSAGKFSDKLVDLVGDLTISLSGVHGSQTHKDVFKGLSSAVELLISMERTISEYSTQLHETRLRLVEEKKADA